MEAKTNKIVAPQIAALNRTDIQIRLGCAPARPLLTMKRSRSDDQFNESTINHARFAHAAKIRAPLLQYATRHRLGTRKCKARAGRQILMLSEQAALFARSSSNAAALARIYLSIRSAWTKRSLSRDARTLTRWPLGIRSRRRKLAALGQTFVSTRHVQFGQKADISRLSPHVRFWG